MHDKVLPVCALPSDVPPKSFLDITYLTQLKDLVKPIAGLDLPFHIKEAMTKEIVRLFCEREKASGKLDILKQRISGAIRNLGLDSEPESEVDRLIEKAFQADLDPKTSLINLVRFRANLRKLLLSEKRGRWFAIGVLDMGNFKRINDHFGHEIGDRVIRRIARILRDQLRPKDMLGEEFSHQCGRYGGDEFCFLLYDVPSPAAAKKIAERIRLAVARHDWQQLGLKKVAPRADIGLVCFPAPSDVSRSRAHLFVQHLLVCADRLMYQSKIKARKSGNLEVTTGCFEILGQKVVPFTPRPSGKERPCKRKALFYLDFFWD